MLINAGNKAFNPTHIVMVELLDQPVKAPDPRNGAIREWNGFAILTSLNSKEQFLYETREECEKNHAAFVVELNEALSR